MTSAVFVARGKVAVADFGVAYGVEPDARTLRSLDRFHHVMAA